MMSALLLATAALFFLNSCEGFTFDLPAMQSKCYVEDLPGGFSMRLVYNVDQGYSQFVDFKLSEPSGKIVQQSLSTNAGSYDLSTNDVGGEYSFCFTNRLFPGVKMTLGMKRVINVDFVYAADLRQYDNALKREHLRPVESKLRMSLDLAKQVQFEYSYMKDREIQMRNTNESTNARTMWMRLLMAAVALAVGFIQVSSMRSYLRRRKFI